VNADKAEEHWLLQKQTLNGVYYADTPKTHLRNVIWKKTRVLDEGVVSASRQCMAAYCACDGGDTGGHW
jgi:hypothetical protein